MEELGKDALAENLIKSVEETYADLRSRHPGKDEHWFLANTWLERYGSGHEAKEKGVEWARFSAYKETYDLAILEPPQSVRALALLIVCKELGEPQAKRYEAEFFKLMEPIIQSKNGRVFFDQYREKNPLTWEEIQTEGGDWTYSLFWFFRGLELEQAHDEVGDLESGEFDFLDQLEKQEEQDAEKNEIVEPYGD